MNAKQMTSHHAPVMSKRLKKIINHIEHADKKARSNNFVISRMPELYAQTRAKLRDEGINDLRLDELDFYADAGMTLFEKLYRTGFEDEIVALIKKHPQSIFTAFQDKEQPIDRHRFYNMFELIASINDKALWDRVKDDCAIVMTRYNLLEILPQSHVLVFLAHEVEAITTRRRALGFPDFELSAGDCCYQLYFYGYIEILVSLLHHKPEFLFDQLRVFKDHRNLFEKIIVKKDVFVWEHIKEVCSGLMTPQNIFSVLNSDYIITDDFFIEVLQYVESQRGRDFCWDTVIDYANSDNTINLSMPAVAMSAYMGFAKLFEFLERKSPIEPQAVFNNGVAYKLLDFVFRAFTLKKTKELSADLFHSKYLCTKADFIAHKIDNYTRIIEAIYEKICSRLQPNHPSAPYDFGDYLLAKNPFLPAIDSAEECMVLKVHVLTLKWQKKGIYFNYSIDSKVTLENESYIPVINALQMYQFDTSNENRQAVINMLTTIFKYLKPQVARSFPFDSMNAIYYLQKGLPESITRLFIENLNNHFEVYPEEKALLMAPRTHMPVPYLYEQSYDLEIYKKLWAHDYTRFYGKTPLHHAARIKNITLFEYAAHYEPAYCTLADGLGLTPVMVALLYQDEAFTPDFSAEFLKKVISIYQQKGQNYWAPRAAIFNPYPILTESDDTQQSHHSALAAKTEAELYQMAYIQWLHDAYQTFTANCYFSRELAQATPLDIAILTHRLDYCKILIENNILEKMSQEPTCRSPLVFMINLFVQTRANQAKNIFSPDNPFLAQFFELLRSASNNNAVIIEFLFKGPQEQDNIVQYCIEQNCPPVFHMMKQYFESEVVTRLSCSQAENMLCEIIEHIKHAPTAQQLSSFNQFLPLFFRWSEYRIAQRQEIADLHGPSFAYYFEKLYRKSNVLIETQSGQSYFEKLLNNLRQSFDYDMVARANSDYLLHVLSPIDHDEISTLIADMLAQGFFKYIQHDLVIDILQPRLRAQTSQAALLRAAVIQQYASKGLSLILNDRPLMTIVIADQLLSDKHLKQVLEHAVAAMVLSETTINTLTTIQAALENSFVKGAHKKNKKTRQYPHSLAYVAAQLRDLLQDESDNMIVQAEFIAEELPSAPREDHGDKSLKTQSYESKSSAVLETAVIEEADISKNTAQSIEQSAKKPAAPLVFHKSSLKKQSVAKKELQIPVLKPSSNKGVVLPLAKIEQAQKVDRRLVPQTIAVVTGNIEQPYDISLLAQESIAPQSNFDSYNHSNERQLDALITVTSSQIPDLLSARRFDEVLYCWERLPLISQQSFSEEIGHIMAILRAGNKVEAVQHLEAFEEQQRFKAITEIEETIQWKQEQRLDLERVINEIDNEVTVLQQQRDLLLRRSPMPQPRTATQMLKAALKLTTT